MIIICLVGYESTDYLENSNIAVDLSENKEPIFYITPKIAFCDLSNPNGEVLLTKFLDEIEPGGPHGKVQVGYVLSFQLLDFYKKKVNQWQLNLNSLNQSLEAAARIARPFLISLNANHFGTIFLPDLTKELMEDPINLMMYSDGRTALDKYFESPIIPFTLSTNENIPVNHYRFRAFQEAVKVISIFANNNPDLLVGVTLNGETHHLFENFSNGTGNFKNIKVTDYSSVSKDEFRLYLKKKIGTIEKLNKILKSSFNSWRDIEPPSISDFTTDPWNFFNSYAHGIIPIYGWLYPSEEISELRIYLNGQLFGKATMNLNRLDVYEAVDEIQTPNVGFRYNLDFSELPTGNYELQILVMMKNKTASSFGQRKIFVKNSYYFGDFFLKHNPTLNAKRDKNIMGYIDSPKNNLKVIYNPLAKIWQAFREEQVNNFIEKLAKIAIESGLNKELIFSYQLIPWLNADWNELLFAVNESFFQSDLMYPGITLYGGLAISQMPLDIISQNKTASIRRYGVPEFHPLMHKNPDSAYRALLFHLKNGAVFVAPYFMSLLDAPGESEHEMFLIEPENESHGSNHLYSAIIKIAAK